jgi:hypothetical protein
MDNSKVERMKEQTMAKISLLKTFIWVALTTVVDVEGYSAVRAYQDYFVPAVNTPAPPRLPSPIIQQRDGCVRF